MQAVPLSTIANNDFNITLFINGKNVTLNLFFSYNEQAGYWTMDIRDSKKKPLECNIPLLCNRDLLEGLEGLKIGHAYFVRKNEEASVNADFNTLAQDYYLLWGDN